MKVVYIFILVLGYYSIFSQSEGEWVDALDIENIELESTTKFWLNVTNDGMAQPIGIPIIIIKGREASPVLGLTAAIHGNELNGIKVIHELIEEINVSELRGTIIAIPGLNSVSIPRHQRKFVDDIDLNRIFPGKENGNRSQQFVWQIKSKILSKLDYLVDMHTASFGRVNSLYVRANLKDEVIDKMARYQDADIILHSLGLPSAGSSSSTRTMRAEAMLDSIPTITVEYGNPQVFQPEMVERGKKGILNLMRGLSMIEGDTEILSTAVVCEKSYWIYVDDGGYLEIVVDLKQLLKKGELIAILRNPFGDIIKEYFCPEDGIVIGKSSNPINMSGGRIIHLGILQD